MLLEMKNIYKRYDQVLANRDVNICLNQGEILAIVGENGAGKSTIMKILYGLEKANSGEIVMNGKTVHFKSAQDAIKHHIGMVQQHFMLFDSFRVFENIVYGNEPKRAIFFDRKKAVEVVEGLSKQYGLDVNPHAWVKDCSIGQQQRIEILKVLYQNAEIIIFDEPTAVLTPQEVKELLTTIKQLAQLGKSIILITHKLQEVMDIADRIYVMRKGEVVQEVYTKDTTIEELSYLMVGKHLEKKEFLHLEKGSTVFQTNELTCTNQGKHSLDHVSIHVKEKEIVGIAGVSGNGQSELIKAISGLIPYHGDIFIHGKSLNNLSVREIREAGFACIPEDRYHSGCAKDATLQETALMASQYKKEFSNGYLLDNAAIEKYSQQLVTDYDVRYASLQQSAGSLSGGNIQKLIVARELSHDAKFIIAAEPTRGVDIGAMEFIHKKLLDKKKDGAAILLISSELSEIIDLSDRIYVIYDGKIVGEFTQETANLQEIGYLMMGGQQ